MTILFIDVRGATLLAESMSSDEFSRLMNCFYAATTAVLVKTDAYIDKLVGDEVMAVYLPLFASREPARQAVRAAEELLRAAVLGDDWLGRHSGRGAPRR